MKTGTKRVWWSVELHWLSKTGRAKNKFVKVRATSIDGAKDEALRKAPEGADMTATTGRVIRHGTPPKLDHVKSGVRVEKALRAAIAASPALKRHKLLEALVAHINAGWRTDELLYASVILAATRK